MEYYVGMLHKLHLTDAKYRNLLLLSYLGNWLANANSVPGSESYPELSQLLSKLYKSAKLSGLKV